jgi:hypothetical protein
MTFVHTGPMGALSAIFWLMAVLFAALSFGRVLLKGLCGSAEGLRTEERIIFSLAFGFTSLSLLMLALGLFGMLTKFHAVTLLGFFLIFAPGIRKEDFSFSEAPERRWLFFLALVAFFLSWIGTTLPPIGNDALSYHLADPKAFILKGRVYGIPLSRESLWPYQTEMLFMLGLLLQGTSLAQALHWIFYPLTAFSIYAFGLRFLSRKEAFLSSLIFIFTPAAFALSSGAYVDLALAFFVFLSFYAFLLKETVGGFRASVVSGVLCGAALATKYSGLNAALILVLFWLSHKKGVLRCALYFAAGAFFVSGVWYLRSYQILGNPVYPFFSGIFGGRGFEFGIQSSLGSGNGLWSFLLLLWDMTFYPKLFGGDILGPFYLLFVPLAAAFVKELRRPLVFLSMFSFLYACIFFKTAMQVRYFVPALPFLSVIAGFALTRLMIRGKLTARVSGFIFGVLILLHTGIYFYKTRDAWKVLSGAENAEHYLLRRERSYSAYRYLNQTPKSSTIFNAATEPRRFYGDERLMVMDDANLRFFLAAEKKSLPAYLGERDFDLIWVSPLSDPLVHDFIRQHSYLKVFSCRFEEGGTLFEYAIYGKSTNRT